MLLTINLILSLLFLIMKHPLSMGMILIMQTLTITLIMGMMNNTYWFSYLLFLIMIGGMLILFMYMTSIMSNKKFSYFNKKLIILILPGFGMISYINNDFITDSNLNKYLNLPSMFLMFIMIIYLFIIMIAVVKITKFKMGPLRTF
uniref:NADH-ubiquinone oxidoreductase chain 6 n=1 Tax=Ptiliidae sp. BMNH 1274724 TaxID=1796537 RepID=A0A126TGE1_9COLE|nr:NADH dehydrogenase subunit 6 [Ptiliidae sp. BMNH 1274724]